MKTFLKILQKNKLPVIFLLSLCFLNMDLFFVPQGILSMLRFVILLFIIPLGIITLTKARFPKNLSLLFFLMLSIFFFLYTPVVFFIHYLLNVPLLTVLNALNLIILTLSIIFNILKPLTLPSYSFYLTKNSSLLLLAILLGSALHLLFFHFYKFIPEGDGYLKIMEIKNVINGAPISMHRGLFTTALASISIVSKISLYTLFSVHLVYLQVFCIILAIHTLLQSNKLSFSFRLLLLFAPFASPVLNMEIDIVRPQSILLIFLFVYVILIDYILKNYSHKSTPYWLLTTSIALLGILYHALFLIILLAHTFFVASYVKKYFLQSKTMRFYSLPILFSIPFLIISLGWLLHSKIPVIKIFYRLPSYIIHEIATPSKWQLWFIDYYTTETELGWSGLIGTLKYYAYYTSPLVIFFTLLTIILLVKKKQKFKLSILTTTLIVLFAVPFIFAEILPRMGFFYLPERMWLSIVISSILLVTILSKKIFSLSSKYYLPFILFAYTLVLIGVSGSVYVASQKKAYTSDDEYQASQWVKKNTPPNSMFITQLGNSPMITFFANRDMSTATSNFFNNPFKKLSTSLINPSQKSTRTKSMSPKNYLRNDLVTIPTYALYSTQKFDNIYSKRKWWRESNHYGAQIENLTKSYPLVYSNNGIYIWRLN